VQIVFRSRLILSFSLLPYTTLFRSHPALGDALHLLFNLWKVLGSDLSFGHMKIVVKSVLHDGPNCEFRLRKDSQDRVGHHVRGRSEEHTSELQSRENLVCRVLLEKK